MSKKVATVVPEKAHSSLGASSASRWMACPGSVRLSEGMPDYESPAAKEGTAAHALAELALTKKQDPSMWVGLELEGVQVTEDMADFVRIYTEHCTEQAAGRTSWIERRFNLGHLNPPAPMFGTADFVTYDPATKTLEVIDLKFGSGVVVEVVGNKQLRYYGLGALLSMDTKQFPIDHVRVTIVQPRARHKDGVIRSEEMTIGQLYAFAEELLDAAARTIEPDAPLAVGDHCRFCKAIAVCPAQKANAQAVAQTEFGIIEGTLPVPERLSIDELTRLLEEFPIIEGWMRAVRVHLENKLNAGEKVPGFKLVEKRANRAWRDEGEAIQTLISMKLTDEDMFNRELRSPAQIEKIVGKKAFPTDLVVKKSSGTTMVAEADPRPAVSLGEEFTAADAATA